MINSTIDHQMPSSYGHLISEADYHHILDICLKLLSRYGQLESVKEGCIRFTVPHPNNSTQMQVSLDSLVRKCARCERDEWQEIIEEHFSHLSMNEAALNYIFKDYEFARTLLKVLVKPFDCFPGAIDQLVHREDFPNTYSFVVIDFEDKFHFVNRQHVTEWEQSEEQLFEDAFQNLSQEDVTVKEVELTESAKMFGVFSGNYAASLAVHLNRNFYYTIGEYGAVVAIPSKSACFIYPVNDASVMSYVAFVIQLIQDFYQKDEYPITDEFYWFYEGKYQRFVTGMTAKNEHFIAPPPQLFEIIMRLINGNSFDNDDTDE